MNQVHMFWAYGALSRLEICCATSFINCGYNLNYWSYDKIPNLPAGAILKDAREILSENLVFVNKSGSYASFSDLFRYAVLSRHGGIWSDSDVFAVCRFDDLPKANFLVTEFTPFGMQINNNIISNIYPKEGNLIDVALAYSMNYDRSSIKWSELGPDLITSLACIIPQHDFQIMPPDFANPFISEPSLPNKLLGSRIRTPESSAFIHLFNEHWRNSGVNKNLAYPKGSFMDLVDGGGKIEFSKENSLQSQKVFVFKPDIVFLNRELQPPLIFKLLSEFCGTLASGLEADPIKLLADKIWNFGVRLCIFYHLQRLSFLKAKNIELH